jgi:hypothetical protein
VKEQMQVTIESAWLRAYLYRWRGEMTIRDQTVFET